MLLCRPTNVTTAINLQALRLSFLLSSLRRNPKLDRQECPVCPRAVSKLSNTPVDFPYIQLASSININDRFDGHKNTDVGLFVLRQPAVVGAWFNQINHSGSGKHNSTLTMSVTQIKEMESIPVNFRRLWRELISWTAKWMREDDKNRRESLLCLPGIIAIIAIKLHLDVSAGWWMYSENETDKLNMRRKGFALIWSCLEFS